MLKGIHTKREKKNWHENKWISKYIYHKRNQALNDVKYFNKERKFEKRVSQGRAREGEREREREREIYI